MIILLLLVATPGWAQTKITWETLADIEFTDKYNEEVDAYYKIYYSYVYQNLRLLRSSVAEHGDLFARSLAANQPAIHCRNDLFMTKSPRIFA
jgi:hypothetical protein